MHTAQFMHSVICIVEQRLERCLCRGYYLHTYLHCMSSLVLNQLLTLFPLALVDNGQYAMLQNLPSVRRTFTILVHDCCTFF